MTDLTALRLVAAGADLEQVARQLDISVEEAGRQVAGGLQHARPNIITATQDLQIEIVHLDLIRRALTPAALRGDPGAASILVRLAALRHQLRRSTTHPTGDRMQHTAVGRPADWYAPDSNTVPQVCIGDQVFEGSALRVQRFTTLGGRHVYRLELVDAILIEGGN